MIGIRSMIAKKTQWKLILAWGLLLALCVVTRCWRVTTIPSGIHIDEAAMAYDAWCLAEFGVDRYIKSWPAYLNNFGGGQSSLYAFVCALFIKAMGFGVWSIRLPGIIVSVLNVVYGTLIAQRIYGKKSYWCYGLGALLVICPYFIMAGRFGLDCNLMLGISTAFLYYFICAIGKKNWKYYCIAGIVGGVLLYTYALTYVILPVFLILAGIYLMRTKEFSLKMWGVMAVPMGIIALPLILVQIVNIFDLQEFQLGFMTITKLDYYRASEMQPFSWEYLLKVFRSILFYDELAYNSIPGKCNLYVITNVLFVVGLIGMVIRMVYSFVKRKLDTRTFIIFWFIAIVYYGSHIISGVNRLNGVFFVVILIAFEAVTWLRDVKSRWKWGVIGAIGIIYIYSFLDFGNYYYNGQYTADTYPLPYFDVELSEGIEYIENDPVLRLKDTYMAEHAIYYAISALPSPYDLQWAGDNMYEYGNYHFNALAEIDTNANYLVHQIYGDYAQDLRELGFEEKWYGNYWLFYMK